MVCLKIKTHCVWVYSSVYCSRQGFVGGFCAFSGSGGGVGVCGGTNRL